MMDMNLTTLDARMDASVHGKTMPDQSQNVQCSSKNSASTPDPGRVCWFLGMSPSIEDNRISDTRTRGQTLPTSTIVIVTWKSRNHEVTCVLHDQAIQWLHIRWGRRHRGLGSIHFALF